MDILKNQLIPTNEKFHILKIIDQVHLLLLKQIESWTFLSLSHYMIHYTRPHS
jgi:hypothetical protein